MAVTTNIDVHQRPWQGYDDPGLPVGMWIAQGTLLGTATGGAQDIGFVFKGEGDPLGARFFNIEQVEIHTTRVGTIEGSLILDNFDLVSATGLVNRRIHFTLISDGITDSSMRSDILPLPIFMGRPLLPDLTTELRAEIINTDGETLFFTGQGYIWEPRSLLAPGGLRRPLDSLYG